jgi:rhodanese-related sulfurtransferase
MYLAMTEREADGGSPPGGETTIDELLAEARSQLNRLSPDETRVAVEGGALLIDIRSEVQRERDGVISGSHFIPRNVFEWRCDPSSEYRDMEVVGGPDRQLIVMCDEGYQSSLAAVTLHRFGFADASDMIGGFQAWRNAGLEVRPL